MENTPESRLHSIASRVGFRLLHFIARGLLRHPARNANGSCLAMTRARVGCTWRPPKADEGSPCGESSLRATGRLCADARSNPLATGCKTMRRTGWIDVNGEHTRVTAPFHRITRRDFGYFLSFPAKWTSNIQPVPFSPSHLNSVSGNCHSGSPHPLTWRIFRHDKSRLLRAPKDPSDPG